MIPTKIDTAYMIGYELRLPVSKEALEMSPTDRDEWGIKQIRTLTKLRPMNVTVVRKAYESSLDPVALIVMSYNYKKFSNHRVH